MGLFIEATEGNCHAPIPSVRRELLPPPPPPPIHQCKRQFGGFRPWPCAVTLKLRPRLEMDQRSGFLPQNPPLNSISLIGIWGSLKHLNGAMAGTGLFLLRSSPLWPCIFQGFLRLPIATQVYLEAHAPQIYIRFTKPHQAM